QKIIVQKARDEVDRISKMVRKGFTPEANLAKARNELVEAEAKLAELQGQVNHVLGKPRAPLTATEKALRDYEVATRLAVDLAPLDKSIEAGLIDLATLSRLSGAKPAPVRGPMAERIRKALDRKVSFRLHGLALEEVLRGLEKECPDLV